MEIHSSISVMKIKIVIIRLKIWETNLNDSDSERLHKYEMFIGDLLNKTMSLNKIYTLDH